MHVVDDHVRAHPEQSTEVLDGLQERGVGRRMLQVADVVAGHELPTLGHGDRALELGPHREHLAAGDVAEAMGSGA